MQENLETDQKILRAARKIFVQKGLTGTRMQDIADEAGINKALLHYYYRSKKLLFEIVFKEHKQKMFENLIQILNSDKSVMEKVEQVIEHEQDSLQAFPTMPLFIMNEVHQNPERVFELHTGAMKEVTWQFFKQIEQEIAEGKIRAINPMDLLINLVSLNTFPYLACPMFMHTLGMSEKDVEEFLQNRRHTIKEFFRQALSLEK
ncbi:MAG: TetR/AcrR family transcriptional regulator [Microscillaceae bacterium]|nr:TetR/AcrR family transcriptional regulator [Microscillaceae bacterium]